MAALLKKSAKGGKSGKPGKGVHGRLPTKRSINLVLVDEKKINIPMTVLSIILIVGLAFLFGKYLVADRLIAVSEAAAKVERLQADLDDTMELLNGFGDVEGMNQAELDLVDRVQVLDLVTSILPEQPEAGEAEEEDEDDEWFDDEDDEWFDDEDDELEDGGESEDDGEPRYVIRNWSVSENVLTVEIGGPSLESLNLLAKSLEDNPIVNSCAITTANKDGQSQAAGEVLAKLIVYLQKPVEEVKAP